MARQALLLRMEEKRQQGREKLQTLDKVATVKKEVLPPTRAERAEQLQRTTVLPPAQRKRCDTARCHPVPSWLRH